MKRILYPIILSALAGGCGTKAAVSGRPTDTNLRATNAKNESEAPWEFAVRVSARVSGVSSQDLERLVVDPDCTIALSAGWRRVLMTVPEDDQSDQIRPDEVAIHRFLGLVEGRVRVPIPPIWVAGVTSVIFNRAERPDWDDYLSFPTPKRLDEASYKPRADVGDASFRRANDRWLVTQGSEEWSLPAYDGVGPVDYVRVHLCGGDAYVALYAWPPDGHMVHAIDRNSGEVMWSSKVWGSCGLLAYSGWGWHEVAFRSTSDKLVVFGLSSNIAYIEVFDKHTGADLWRFNTYLGTELSFP